ncbi:MAG: septum formation initiator family protein [Candidatus Wildermuthbacteria bacterium]|nr:septum formation initiator family protein [Candidatus Wildermuthbacteria bacterium]
MITKNKKSRKGSLEQIIFSIFLGVLTLGIVGFLIVSDFRINQKRSQLSDQIESMKKEAQALEERNANLEKGISQTGKDVYWEEKVREQGYQKPGEQQVVVLPSAGDRASSTEKSENLWQRFLNPIRNFFR